jgi:hypothetical protein
MKNNEDCPYNNEDGPVKNNEDCSMKNNEDGPNDDLQYMKMFLTYS